MNVNSATRRGHPIVFGFLVVAAIIEMCIAAWVTAQYNQNHNFPSLSLEARVRYILFASIWTVFLGSLYLVLFMLMAGHKITSIGSHFVFLSLTWLFWLAAAAALTQSLGGALNCDLLDTFAYCGQLNAMEGFAWLIWLVLTLMLLFVLIRGIMGARQGNGVTAPMVEV